MMFNFSLKKLIRASLCVALTTALAATALAQPKQDFTLRSTDGRTVTANDLRGRVVVLAFGASWLPLSRAQVQDVQKLADRYAGKVEIFWVSTDSTDAKSKNYASDEQVQAFAQKNNLRVRVLRDADGAVSKTFGVTQVPAVVILNREGQLAGAPIGGYNASGNFTETLAARINNLL